MKWQRGMMAVAAGLVAALGAGLAWTAEGEGPPGGQSEGRRRRRPPPPLLRALAGQGIEVVTLSEVVRSLEDVYLRVVEGA